MVGFVASLLGATVSAGTVFIFAGLGELISERAGILNLGVEGMMLVGALTGYVTTAITGSNWLGFIVGSFCGAGLSLLHAFLCISLKSDQAISGVMITLLGTGLTTYFGVEWTSTSIGGFSEQTLPLIGQYLVQIPVLGIALFQNTPTDYIAILLVPIVWAFLHRTNIGLEIIAVGDDPETADTMGVEVFRIQYLAVLIGGLLAGAAGAHLSLAFNQLWSTQMTAGRGWIAVALVIFAQWRPMQILSGAYLFGFFNAFQLRSQALSLSLPADIPLAAPLNGLLEFLLNPTIMSNYPYIVTLLVLVLVVIRSDNSQLAQPSALVESYSRETD